MRTVSPSVRRRKRRQRYRAGASVELDRDDGGSTPRRRPERAGFYWYRTGADREFGAELRRRDGDRLRRGGDRERLCAPRRRDIDVFDVMGRVVADLKRQHRDQRHHQTRREAAPGARASPHPVKSCIPPLSSKSACYTVVLTQWCPSAVGRSLGISEDLEFWSLGNGAMRAYALQFCATSALPRPLSSEERYMLRDAEPVGAACLSGSRRGGAAGLEGRARRAPTMQRVIKRSSEPPALPRARATYGTPARPVGTTPPTTPSPISPIAALIEAIIDTPPLPTQDMANAMPAVCGEVRRGDVPEMQQITQSAVTNPVASHCLYKVTLTLCR